MPDFLFANNASSTLAIELNTIALTITLAAATGDRFPDPVQYAEEFVITLKNTTTGEIEIVNCVERSGDVLNIVRAREGTVALSFPVGAAVVHQMTAAMFAYLRDL
jgi:hypothetical protein